MAKNDVKFLKQSKPLTSFFAMKRRKYGAFFRQKLVRTRVLITYGFKIDIHESRVKLLRFFDFQAIILFITEYDLKFQWFCITQKLCVDFQRLNY